MTSSFWKKVDVILVIGVFFGVLICWSGIISNRLTLHLNDGKFPVVLSEGQYIIPTERNIHVEAEASSKAVIFSDWIRMDFKEINSNNAIFKWWAKGLNYPIEGGLNIVSIGDLMMWFGSATFLIFLGPLIIRILFRLF